MTGRPAANSSRPAALADVLTDRQIALLKEHWIETPEQFISVVATQEGRTGLCILLARDGERLDDCVKRLSEGLPAEVVKRLQSPQPGGKLGVKWARRADGPDDTGQGGGA